MQTDERRCKYGAKYIKVTADFSAVCFHDSRLTATDECAHRLRFQTFGPEVRSQSREAAVCVDWC